MHVCIASAADDTQHAYRSVDSCCTSIELARNNVGADGAAALGALLRDNTLLKTLDISALPGCGAVDRSGAG